MVQPWVCIWVSKSVMLSSDACTVLATCSAACALGVWLAGQACAGQGAQAWLFCGTGPPAARVAALALTVAACELSCERGGWNTSAPEAMPSSSTEPIPERAAAPLPARRGPRTTCPGFEGGLEASAARPRPQQGGNTHLRELPQIQAHLRRLLLQLSARGCVRGCGGRGGRLLEHAAVRLRKRGARVSKESLGFTAFGAASASQALPSYSRLARAHTPCTLHCARRLRTKWTRPQGSVARRTVAAQRASTVTMRAMGAAEVDVV